MSGIGVHIKKKFLKICALLACSLALSACDTSASAPVQEGTSPVQPAPTTPVPVPTPSPAPTPEDEGKRGTIPATGGKLKHRNVTVAAVEGFTSGEVDVTIKKEPITAADTAKLGEGVRLIDKFSIKSNNNTNAQLIVNLDLKDKVQPGEVSFIFQEVAGQEPELVGIVDEGEVHAFEASVGPGFQGGDEQGNNEVETSSHVIGQDVVFYIEATKKFRLVNDENGAWNGHFYGMQIWISFH